MTAFAIYNDAGEIIRTGNCPESDLHLKVKDGENIFIGVADQITNKVIDGALVDIEVITLIDEMRLIRQDRNHLLTKSDWTQLPDAPLSEAQRQAWAEYRQALRDLPESNFDPNLIQWPQPPEV